MAPEILAPVGGSEQLDAAIRAGADAVYLGTQSFNARRNAANFSSDELPAVVSECHRAGVRVHVTFNTLLSDRELPAALAEIGKIAASGADAVIVQDPGAAKLFREYCPTLPLHASTQMTIHDAEGVLAARELGFSRVVLARELSLREIESIRKTAPEIELEVFVHGALCVSLSGVCYLSAMLGGRSGNRGLCAGPCRLDFRSRGREYALSLKDLSAMDFLPELARIGVSSFKIEGRMKGPAYVAAAVHACREKLAGRDPDMDLLERVFSRSGFTSGYLTGKTDAGMFGRRTEEDEAASGEVRDRKPDPYGLSEDPSLFLAFPFPRHACAPYGLGRKEFRYLRRPSSRFSPLASHRPGRCRETSFKNRRHAVLSRLSVSFKPGRSRSSAFCSECHAEGGHFRTG